MSLQGTILGYSTDAGTGAITGADGKRYKFSASDWKGGSSPVAGAAVDFELDAGGQATGIYPLRPMAASSASRAPAQAAPDIGRYAAAAASRPGLVAAALALVVSAFLGFIEVTAPPNRDDLGLPDSVTVLESSELMKAAERAVAERTASYTNQIERQGQILESIQQAQARDEEIIAGQVERYRQVRAAYGPMYGYERTPDAYGAALREQMAESINAQSALPRRDRAVAEARLDRLNHDKGLIPLGYLLYLIPLSAALVLSLELTRRPSRAASVLMAVSVAVGVAAIYFAGSRLGGLFGDLAGESRLPDLSDEAASGRAVSAADASQATANVNTTPAGFVPDAQAALVGEALLSPALGAWLLLAIAAGLLALTFGLVRTRSDQPVEP